MYKNAVCIGYEDISRKVFSVRQLQCRYHYLVMDMIQWQLKADIKHESACVCFTEAGASLIKTYHNAWCINIYGALQCCLDFQYDHIL